ncbi:MAG: helix-turn-helix domain-containing protein [Salinibacterium sp.]|nr:helix-turn-helix domain-containing protein [Salinibacterium sp.]
MHIDSSRPSFGLASERSHRARMAIAHQHDDIEFNFAPTAMSYRIDGTIIEIPPKRLTAFWAARPHQLVDDAPDDWVHWLTVPLGLFVSWTAPGLLVASLLRGEVVVLTDDPLGAPPINRLEQWSSDLRSGTAWSETTVRLELEAYLRRLSFAPLSAAEPRTESGVSARPSRLAGEMAAYIAAHSDEPIAVADVARAVHVHPGYAMTVFRRAVGTTIGSYLTQCRVAHAQRLLITSALPVREIGLSIGFQSVSQFYDRFGAACGTSPGLYRRKHARKLD